MSGPSSSIIMAYSDRLNRSIDLQLPMLLTLTIRAPFPRVERGDNPHRIIDAAAPCAAANRLQRSTSGYLPEVQGR